MMRTDVVNRFFALLTLLSGALPASVRADEPVEQAQKVAYQVEGGSLAELAESFARMQGRLASQMADVTAEMDRLANRGDAESQRQLMQLMIQFQSLAQQYNALLAAYSAAVSRLGEASGTMVRKN